MPRCAAETEIYMRSCIYCGRELEKGEVCSCPQSVARRHAKSNASSAENSREKSGNNSYNPNYNQNTYTTGYTKKESKIKRAWERHKMKRSIKRSEEAVSKNLLVILKQFFKSPVETVINPPYMSKLLIIVLAALQGALVWLSMYFILTNVRRGPFAMLAAFLSFNGHGYQNILEMLFTVLSGAISGVMLYFIYSGVFYGINRLVFRFDTRFWDFSQRFALTGIPLAVVGVAGALFSTFSSTTLMILMLCGAASWVVLTYEGLKTEWITKTSGKTAYAMMLGFFIIFSVICYMIRLS